MDQPFERIFDKFRKSKLTIFLGVLLIVIRIPRSGRISGDDAFLVSFYGILFSKGYFTDLLLHPLTFFGLYPLSSYPVLVELIFAGIYLVTNDVLFTWYTLSFLLTFFGIIFTNNFLKTIKISSPVKELVLLVYLSHPMYLLYTTGSIVTRAAFLALLPLFLHHVVLILTKSNFHYLVLGLISSTLLLTSHRVGIIAIPIYGLALLIWIITKSRIVKGFSHNNFNTIVSSKLTYVIFLLTFTATGILSTFLVPISEQFIGTSGLLEIHPGPTAFFELLIDQALRAGLSSLLGSLLVVKRIISSDLLDKSLIPIEFFSLLFMIGGFMFLPLAWYVSLILALPLALLSGILIHELISDMVNKNFKFSIFAIILIILYSISSFIAITTIKNIFQNYVIVYSLLFLLCFALLFASLALFIMERINKQYLYLGLLSIVLVQSVFYVDTLVAANDTGFPYPVLSQDEIDLSQKLLELNISGRVLSSHYLVGKRMMGLTGILFYEDQFGGSGLISGYVNESDLETNINLTSPFSWWKRPSIYEFNETLAVQRIKDKLFGSSLLNKFVVSIFKQENTKYIVVTTDMNYTNRYISSRSKLISDIVNNPNTELIFNSTNLLLYRFSVS